MSSSNVGPPPPPAPPQFRMPSRPPYPVTSGKAIAAFVLALLSMFFWILAALPALFLALSAKSDIRREPDRVGGGAVANFAMLIALGGIIVPPLLIALIVSSFDFSPATGFRRGPALAHVHLSGFLPEPSAVQDPFTMFAGPPFSSGALLRTIEVARQDNNVKGLILTVDNFFTGAAQREELINAFQSFKDAGKDIYVHTTTLDTGSYALFAHATRLSLVPTDSVFLTGLYSEGLYLKDAIDNLHADVQVIHIGDYKSAGESFTQTGPSEEAATNQNWIMDDRYENLVNSIAAAREMEPHHVRALIDGGPYGAEQAAALGLIDSVEFIDDFMDDIRDAHQDNVQIDDHYAGRISRRHVENGTSLTGLADGNEASAEKSVALVTIEGTILPGYGENSPIGTDPNAYGDVIRKILQIAQDDQTVGAVVLRINSPGGAVTASEVILHAIEELQKDKPVVVSMGDVAASGGYYVACSADRIFADSSTITGSIGVVGGKLIIGRLLDEIGVDVHPYQRGENADIVSMSEPFDAVQTQRIRSHMESAYATFLDHVETHRGEKLMKPLDELAAGRVFTGDQAKDVGLVDEIGGMQAAVAHAAELAGLAKYEVRLLPETKDFWSLLLQDLSGTGERPSDLSSIAHAMLESHAKANAAPDALKLLQQLDPMHARALYRHFLALTLLHRENVLALDTDLLSL